MAIGISSARIHLSHPASQQAIQNCTILGSWLELHAKLTLFWMVNICYKSKFYCESSCSRLFPSMIWLKWLHFLTSKRELKYWQSFENKNVFSVGWSAKWKVNWWLPGSPIYPLEFESCKVVEERRIKRERDEIYKKVIKYLAQVKVNPFLLRWLDFENLNQTQFMALSISSSSSFYFFFSYIFPNDTITNCNSWLKSWQLGKEAGWWGSLLD